MKSIFWGLTFFTTISLAQTEFNDRRMLPKIDLGQAIYNALKTNPNAKIANNNIEIADRSVDIARSGFFPQATLGGTYTFVDDPLSPGEGQAWLGQGILQVGLLVFDMPSVYRYREAKERLRKASFDNSNVQLQVSAQTTNAYISILRQRLILDFAVENYSYLSGLLTNPLATANDIDVLKGAIGRARSDKHVWIESHEKAENDFTRFSDLKAEEFFLVEPETLDTPETEDEALMVAGSLNPSLKGTEVEVLARALTLKGVKSRFLPNVSVQASTYKFDRNSQDFGNMHRDGSSVGVSVSIPLLTGGRRRAEAAAAELALQNAKLLKEDKASEIKNGIQNLYVTIKERSRRIGGLCESLFSQHKTVLSMQGRLFASISVQDFLVERAKLFRAAIALNDEYVSTALDTYQLHIQMGTLLEHVNLREVRPDSTDTATRDQVTGDAVYTRLLDKCKDSN